MQDIAAMKRRYYDLSKLLKTLPDEKGVYVKTPMAKQDVILERTKLAFAIADAESGML